jgi:phosphoribosylaminoimidazole-succinocarboxamide synthase
MRSNVLSSGYLPELGELHSGKIRDSHVVDDRRILVSSDRISAFDEVLNKLIPEKGAILNAIAMWWFAQTEDLIPNHVISCPDPNVIVGHQADVVPIEIVVRGYLTGSAWKVVADGTFADHYGFEISSEMIEGGKLERNCKLNTPIITPTTKAHTGHDQPLTSEQAEAIAGPNYASISKISLELFERGSKLAAERGLILVDTKYEFGILNGKLILVDEVHTPDSSRFWNASEYRSGAEMEELSKQFVRDIVEKGELSDSQVQEISQRYIALYEQITGLEWSSNSNNLAVSQRVVNNLINEGFITGGVVQIIAGSEVDDWHVEKIQGELENLQIPHGHLVCSAHKKPFELLDFIADLNRSIEPIVAITVAGGSDALSGVVGHHAQFPVIACPPYKDETSYAVNVHSSLQMPSLVPALYCKRPSNAALAAERILRNNNPLFAERIR